MYDIKDQPYESETEKFMQALTLSLIMWIQFMLNTTVIIVFCNSKPLRACNHNIFVVNLVVCDLIFAIIVMPISLIDIVCDNACSHFIRTGFMCQMTGFITTFHYMIAGYTLAIISVDRYIAVVHKGRSQSGDGRKPWFIALGILLVWAFVASSIPLLPFGSAKYVYQPGNKHCSPDFKASCWFYWFSVVNGIGAIVPTMTFSYVGIVKEIRRSGQLLKRQGSVVSEGDLKSIASEIGSEGKTKTSSRSRSRVEREVAKRGIGMVLAHWLSWTPYTVIKRCPSKSTVPLWLEVASMWMVFTLTIWNPIIYVFHNRQFKDELKRLMERLKI